MTSKTNSLITEKPKAAVYILVGIPVFLMLIIVVLLLYLGLILRSVETQGKASSCRAKVSQEIQEKFRVQLANLINASSEKDENKANHIIKEMKEVPPFKKQVSIYCAQDL